MELGVRVCASCGVQSTKVAIQIPLFFKDGEMHSYVLSYRSGIEAAAAGLSIHQGSGCVARGQLVPWIPQAGRVVCAVVQLEVHLSLIVLAPRAQTSSNI